MQLQQSLECFQTCYNWLLDRLFLSSASSIFLWCWKNSIYFTVIDFVILLHAAIRSYSCYAYAGHDTTGWLSWSFSYFFYPCFLTLWNFFFWLFKLVLWQATRHARRVYVGGLPPTANEQVFLVTSLMICLVCSSDVEPDLYVWEKVQIDAFSSHVLKHERSWC